MNQNLEPSESADFLAKDRRLHVFDFFSGCGGTSVGLRRAGMNIAFGLDCDPDSSRTFKMNFPKAKFLQADIRDLKTDDLAAHVAACSDAPILFCGCAPCQPFSRQRSTKKHPNQNRDLLDEFGRFVAAFTPHFVLCENVPGLQAVSQDRGPFGRFCSLLRRLGYNFVFDVVECQSYGVPQMRRRLVLIASRIVTVRLPEPTHGPDRAKRYATVREWIGDLPSIRAGEGDPDDPIHRSMRLSPLNLERIRHTPPGGSRKDWPKRLRLQCHTRKTSAGQPYRGHTDVYGRMHLDKPAPALTTRCTSLSNGRYGHPTQHRAISTREAACLQTFPRSFKFSGSQLSIARQVGNAVPVVFAATLGREILRAYRTDGRRRSS